MDKETVHKILGKPKDYSDVEPPVDVILSEADFQTMCGDVIEALKKAREEANTPFFTLALVMGALEKNGICIRPPNGTPGWARDKP